MYATVSKELTTEPLPVRDEMDIASEIYGPYVKQKLEKFFNRLFGMELMHQQLSTLEDVNFISVIPPTLCLSSPDLQSSLIVKRKLKKYCRTPRIDAILSSMNYSNALSFRPMKN